MKEQLSKTGDYEFVFGNKIIRTYYSESTGKYRSLLYIAGCVTQTIAAHKTLAGVRQWAKMKLGV